MKKWVAFAYITVTTLSSDAYLAYREATTALHFSILPLPGGI